jgi:sulfoxide reductase heme-binding subunit YedZ
MSFLLPATATVGFTSARALWYATRSTGAVALLLLTAVVVLGVLGSLRLASVRWPRFAVATLHRDLSLLAIVFIALHVATTVLDGFAPINWLSAVVPFQSPYRSLWLGLGTVAFDLILALVITSLLRVRLGHNRWRKVHWLAYASWPIAAFHGLGTGSDAAQPWLLALTAACGASILIAVLVRIQERWTAGGNLRPWLALTVATPVALLAFVAAGPLSAHWARRAGTPASLLGAPASRGAGATTKLAAAATTETTAATGTTARPTATPSHPFTARLVGSIRQTAVRNGAVIDLVLSLKGGPGHDRGGTLRIRLAGRPLPGGGVALVGSQVDLIPAASASDLTGTLTSLDGTRLSARVGGASGARLNLDANLHVDQRTGSVTGLLTASPTNA